MEKYFALIVLFLFVPTLSFALQWPTSPGGTSFNPATTNLPDLIKYLYEWAITLGGLAAFIMLVVAGFEYLISTGDPGRTRSAKNRIASAIGGLLLLLSSFLILNTINPELVTLKIPSFGAIQNIDCAKPENKQKDECKPSPLAAIFYAGSCKKAIAYEDINFQGSPIGTAILEQRSGIWISRPTPITSPKLINGSLQFLYPYTDPITHTTTEIPGGVCSVDFFENQNCEGEADLSISSSPSLEDLSVYKIKTKNKGPVRCIIVTGAGDKCTDNPQAQGCPPQPPGSATP